MQNYKDPISLLKQTNFSNTIWWKLKVNISGYKNEKDKILVTEIIKNRIFKLIFPNFSYQNAKKFSRILVQFYEDGYVCWINLNGLIIEKYEFKETKYIKNESYLIQEKIPQIIKWIEDIAKLPNHYLWGGTIGPHFDCSGLIQTAFFYQNIYIPRDSFQIKSFCKHLFYFKGIHKTLKSGDLLFFGNKDKCDHVGIYKGDGLYYHCSGKDFGRNGIGLDTLKETNDTISQHYKSKLISAGRVMRSYKWNKTIR